MTDRTPTLDRRIQRVREAMQASGVDAMFVNYGPEFQYVTGIEKPFSYDVGRQPGDWITGLLLTHDGPATLILKQSWMREFENGLPFEVRAHKADDASTPDEFLAAQALDLGLDGKTIAVPKILWSQTLLSLQSALPNARFVPATDGFIDRVRAVKDPDEIALLEEAARITDATFGAVLEQMRIGMLDRDLVIEIDYQFKKHGGDAFSFMPTVVLDGHGARYARQWTDRDEPKPITAGTTVAFDMGVVYRGYCSDFGRSVFMGEPNDEPLRAWKSITKAIQAAMAVMGDGRISPAQVHDFVVEQVTEDGFRDQFSWHALGHGIGLNVHEDPWMLPEFTEPIRAGMCFALEPKIGRPGSFYVRCEDVLVVEQERARRLTTYPYDTIVIE
jgi:Xaa-Pro dipeptidase